MNKRPFLLRASTVGVALSLAAALGGCSDWYDHSQPIRPAYADARLIYSDNDAGDTGASTQPTVAAVRDWYDTGMPYTEGGDDLDNGLQDDGTYSPTYLYSQVLPGYEYGYGPLGYDYNFVGASLYDRPSYAYGYYPYGYGYGVYRYPGYALGRYERNRYFATRAPVPFPHRYPEDFRRYRPIRGDRHDDDHTHVHDDDRGLIDRTPRQPMPIPANPRDRANARDTSNADLAAARARIDAARTRPPVIDRSPIPDRASNSRDTRGGDVHDGRVSGGPRGASDARSNDARSNDGRGRSGPDRANDARSNGPADRGGGVRDGDGTGGARGGNTGGSSSRGGDGRR